VLQACFPTSPLFQSFIAWTCLTLATSSLALADTTVDSTSAPHFLDLRLETTTFLLNLEKQGLEDNTFTNGLGRDTTLIGNLLNVYVRKRLLPTLDLDVGLFANMPFGHDTEISQVRPLVRLQYSPTEDISALLGTLAVHIETSMMLCSTTRIGLYGLSNRERKWW
jgi:hypothetical protein